jgi:hypothetical protein
MLDEAELGDRAALALADEAHDVAMRAWGTYWESLSPAERRAEIASMDRHAASQEGWS